MHVLICGLCMRTEDLLFCWYVDTAVGWLCDTQEVIEQWPLTSEGSPGLGVAIKVPLFFLSEWEEINTIKLLRDPSSGSHSPFLLASCKNKIFYIGIWVSLTLWCCLISYCFCHNNDLSFKNITVSSANWLIWYS